MTKYSRLGCVTFYREKTIRIFFFNSNVECTGYREQMVSCYKFGVSFLLKLTIGRHCCLWCTISSTTMQLPLTSTPLPQDRQENATHRNLSTLRTLETLTTNHTNFLQEGGGNLKKAKEFNNVIYTRFFNIPLDQVRFI